MISNMNINKRVIFTLFKEQRSCLKNVAKFLEMTESQYIRLALNRSFSQFLEIYRERLDQIAKNNVQDYIGSHFKFGKNKFKPKKRFTKKMNALLLSVPPISQYAAAELVDLKKQKLKELSC